MFSRCNDSEDCNRTHSETFSCVRQLTSLVVLVLSRGHCDCYAHSVCILILIFSEPLILTHRTHFKNHCFNVTRLFCKIDFEEQGIAESNDIDISEFSLVLLSDSKPITISIFAELVETVLLELDCF